MDITTLKETLVRECEGVGIELDEIQIDRLVEFARLVLETNQYMNLTGIIEAEEFAIKHLIDCLLLSKTGFPFRGSGIDVGTGPGFPGIVIACGISDAPILLLDSLEKRVNFLLQVKEKLALSNLSCVHGRAEDLAQDKQYRQKFNWVTARAVAPLSILLEYCTPFIKIGGEFLAMKGSQGEEEIEESRKAIKILGLKLMQVHHYQLPKNMGDRTIIQFKKESPTPREYPRKAGIPSKKPL